LRRERRCWCPALKRIHHWRLFSGALKRPFPPSAMILADGGSLLDATAVAVALLTLQL
jgi:hypothetical protein